MRHLPPLVFFALLAIASVGVPTAASMPGHPMSDLYDHAWGYAWFVRQLQEGTWPLWTQQSHGPDGGVLWFVDPLGALLSMPLQLLFPLPVALGLLPIVQLWLALAGGYLLGFSELRRVPAAMVVSVVFALSSYSLSIVHSGTWEYLNLWPFPIFVWGLRQGRVGWAVFGWAAGMFGAFYYGAFLGLLGVILTGAGLVSGRVFGRVLLGALLPLGLIAGVAAWTLKHPQAVIEASSAPGWSYQSLPATDLISFLHPRYWFPDNARMGNPGIVHANSLGLANVALLIWGWRRLNRRMKLALAITGILCLGPTLCISGYIPKIGGYTLPLPAALLYFPGSPFRMVHHPYRMVVLDLLLVAMALGFLLKHRPVWAMVLVVGLPVELALFSPIQWPTVRAPADVPRIYAGLSGGIIDFPPENHLNNRSYTWYAAVHQHRIPYGVNVFVPEKFGKNHRFLQWMGCLRDGGKRGVPREGGPPAWQPPPPPTFTSASLHQADEELRDWSYWWLLAHLRWMDPAEVDCMTKLLGPPTAEDDGYAVWALTDIDGSFTPKP